MMLRNYFLLALSWLLLGVYLLNAQVALGPNSLIYDNIPKGQLTQHSMVSEVYPNTIRDYYIYVPAQYDGSQPAALMVFQDGHTYVKEEGDFRVPAVFDNLIAQEKMPITIGLFINPGHDQSLPPPEMPWRASNRSIEYDTLSDTYVRFLVDEMIPILSKDYRLSDDPKMRAICGISSGGICAFTAAWQRPDVFHRVLSHIGSFTDIKGGHNYPPLIRETDPKPIKVFLQDGSNDLDNRFGNWFLANQQMAKALEFQDYDYKFVTDTGAHNGVHAGLILPESLTWLWQDAVPARLASKKYSMAGGQSNVALSGATTHLSSLACSPYSFASNQEIVLRSDARERIVIVREGKCSVSNGDQAAQTFGPKSVLFMPKNDSIVIATKSEMKILSIQMQARPTDREPLPDDEQSTFLINFDSLSYKSHVKGGRFDYFRRSTALFPYFEMHVTALNPGVQSHPAHTHRAEELIIMIDGNTEEEIGNAKYLGGSDDIYFLGANVPHSIKNVGSERCMYFAFQWSDRD